jgi:cytochrome c-type biogenesis protein CcmH/NrfG
LRTDLPESHFTLGVVLWQTRHLEDAAASFREALAERPGYAEAHYMLGTVLRQLGQTDEAFAEFQRTLDLDSDSAEAWLSIGQILQRRQDKPGSEKAFAEAARLRQKKADQQAATFAVSTGMKRLAEGDVAGAVAQLKEAVRLDAQNPQAQYQLGRALQQSGETGQAKMAFDEARRLLAARSGHAK